MENETLSQDVVENTTPETKAEDPVEEASRKFVELLPYVSKLANASNSKGSLVRVLKAFAEFPLGSGAPRLLNDNEKLLFSLLQEIQGYKSTILTAFMKQSLQKQSEMENLNNVTVNE